MNLRTISGLNERVKELEEHDENHEERLKDLENTIKDVQQKMLFMKPSEGGEGVDMDALSSLLSNYTTKDDFNDLLGWVEKLENEVKELDQTSHKHDAKLQKHKDKLKNHHEEIEKLKK